MLSIVVAIVGLVVSVGLFRSATRSGRKRWFIGTVWEPCVSVTLVVGVLLSVGFLALAIVDLLHLV